MESTGSQHLPHLRPTGRSLLLSVSARTSFSFPTCSPPLPRQLQQLHPQKALNTVSKTSQIICLSLMRRHVQQEPFFCRSTSGTPDEVTGLVGATLGDKSPIGCKSLS
ncbi:hypothetical protein CesoFtcFv8_026207 [Champsocephalus esox]|uniref:Uncharacterized protein n=1 Tax=Champsocephalus esox TaxID=159716 RepID=A0AAN8B2B5_9TELE|nr:hypothetical protein CesoFtcFv8_026207 [Champsocephalus esox]